MTLIEYETSLVFELLAKDCDEPGAKLLLTSVCEDTKKHASIMKSIAEMAGQTYPPPMAGCEIEMGQAYKQYLSFIKSLKGKLKNGMLPLEALDSIMGHEKFMNEEYLSQLHSRVRLVQEQDTAVRRVLEDTAADEERHRELLELAMDRLSRKAIR